MTRIHNIGHIHNTNCTQSQFSMSYPKKHTFGKIENLPFFENISFAGLKSKFLSTQQNLYMSPTQPINMSSIGLKLIKIEQIKFVRFFPSLTPREYALKVRFSCTTPPRTGSGGGRVFLENILIETS